MNEHTQPRTRKVALTLRLNGLWYDAEQRWRATHKMTQEEIYKSGLIAQDGFEPILRQEQEEYARKINQHSKLIEDIKRSV